MYLVPSVHEPDRLGNTVSKSYKVVNLLYAAVPDRKSRSDVSLVAIPTP